MAQSTAGMVAGAPGGSAHPRKYLVLAAMIFAVAMTFIDQTIVSIAVPEIQKNLHLTSTGVQWVVNGYLLALAALFAFGGRLSDIFGHRKMVLAGVVVFAFASAMCGLTPVGSVAEAWIVSFRILQGAGAALMFPAALAIVVSTFPVEQRGKAMAIFFGIAGGLTAVGPILGGYLSEWTWRAIFWVNIPVAIIALVLTLISKPETEYHKAPIDWPGFFLIVGGVGLSVLGLQQSVIWGWHNPATWLCIVAGVALIVAFVFVELRVAVPLMQVRIFRSQQFLGENIVLLISMMVFIPMFFFASEYAQIALGDNASEAGLYLLTFFAGFVVAAQIGGRMLDRAGAKRAVVLGCALGAVGFALWAQRMTELSFHTQWIYIVLSGAGIGLMLGQSNTDAINQAPPTSYGEATGITQTSRNYGASLGLAILGTILVFSVRSHLTASLTKLHFPPSTAEKIANQLAQAGSGGAGAKAVRHSPAVYRAVQLGFASASQTIFYVMAAIMVAAGVAALVSLRSGLQRPYAKGPSGEPAGSAVHSD